MRAKLAVPAAALVLAGSIAVRLAAQNPAPPGPPPAGPAPAGAGPAGGAGRGAAGQGGPARGGGPATFPAQQRQLADQAVIDRGKGIYEITCRACHGADLRGGDQGGPNLLRSQLVLTDQHGELISQVIQSGRQNPGMPVMPPLQMPQADMVAVAEYIHAVAFTMRGQGNPPPGQQPVVLNIVTGDANVGKAYFAAKCSSCHSATGDLAGLATRIPDPMQLQNTWVGGGSAGRGRGAGGGTPTTVTVTQANGTKVEGRLVRADDFIVIVAMADGTTKSVPRDSDAVKVEIKNPRAPHIKLLSTYTDRDMHDVTAYLVTLK